MLCVMFIMWMMCSCLKIREMCLLNIFFCVGSGCLICMGLIWW